MKPLNTASCIKFDKKGLKISIVDLQSKQVILEKSLVCDFEIIDNTGTIINPIQTGAFIQKVANELGITKKVKVSLGLEFVSLNSLFLPPLSGPDFDKIVNDEAKRESPFSFTNDKIAVVYQVSRGKSNENGLSGTEVFAVTTPQGIIDKIVEVFRNTNLSLEVIAPSLIGLKHYLIQQQIDISQPFILIYVTQQDAEFYIWDGQFATAFHYIHYGAKEEDGLQKEITASLEHFNHDSNGKFIPHVIVAGEKCQIQFDNRYTLRFLSGDACSDLTGLASMAKVPDNLNFITEAPKERSTTVIRRLWPVIIGGIFLLNIPIGWNLWSGEQQLTGIRNENLRLHELLNTQIAQLNKGNQLNHHYKIYLLLESVREIVSQDIMFEHLVLDLADKNMQLEGFCLGQSTINNFIQDLLQIEGVRSVEGIQIMEQARADIKGYVFAFQVQLKDFQQ